MRGNPYQCQQWAYDRQPMCDRISCHRSADGNQARGGLQPVNLRIPVRQTRPESTRGRICTATHRQRDSGRQHYVVQACMPWFGASQQ